MGGGVRSSWLQKIIYFTSKDYNIFFTFYKGIYILGAWVQVNFSHFWGGIYIYHNSSMPPPMDIISNGLGSWGHWRPQKPVGFPDYQRWILSFQESICNIRLLNSLSDIYKGKNKCPDRSYILGNYLIIFTMKTHTMFFFLFQASRLSFKISLTKGKKHTFGGLMVDSKFGH